MTPSPFPPSAPGAVQLGRVVDDADPESRGRARVLLFATNVEVWAAVAQPSAGRGYGASLLPKVDEVVVVAFVTPELAVVLGCLWSGDSSHPEDARPVADRYAIVTPKGSTILLDDAGPTVECRTPQGHVVRITDGDGGAVKIEVQGTSIEVTSSKVAVNSSGNVEVQASQVKVSAGQVDVDAGMAKFSGVVKCSTLIADSVVGTSYTPGAGNIW